MRCVFRVASTAICGADLHIYNGHFPQLRNQVLGQRARHLMRDARARKLSRGRLRLRRSLVSLERLVTRATRMPRKYAGLQASNRPAGRFSALPCCVQGRSRRVETSQLSRAESACAADPNRSQSVSEVYERRSNLRTR